MKEMGKPRYHQLILFLFLLCSRLNIGQNKAYAQGTTSNNSRNTTSSFDVGVILDTKTWVGNISWRCMAMAMEDFYNSHSNFTKKLSLHLRDVNKDDRVASASAAIDLLKNVQVQAIIGPQTSRQAKFVIELGNSAQVPIISFTAKSPSLSTKQYPYFIRTGMNDTSQAKVLASLVQNFGWRQVVLIYADTEFGNGIISHVIDALIEIDARVTYRSPIPITANDEAISKELEKLKDMQTRVFIVHMPYSLGFKVFSNANKTGMMNKGYVWITTYVLTDIVDLYGSSATSVMQGVLGIKPYISEDNPRLQDFKARFVKKFKLENPSAQISEPLTVFGLWAYDTVWSLAMAAESLSSANYTFSMNNVRKNSTDLESIGKSQTGLEIVQWISNSTFDGISGKFQLIDRQREVVKFEIVNVVENGRKRIGFWTPVYGFSKELNSKNVSIEVAKWPGDSDHVPPRGWEWPTNGRNLSVGIPVKPGFPEFVNVTTNDSSIRPTGYCIEIFDKVMAALPYKVNYTYEHFANEKGEMNGSYDDLVYQVYLKKYDVVVGDITVIANRSQYVDFTLPYTESGVSMIVPVKDQSRKNAWTFAEPLSTSLWIASGVFFIFTGIVVWILEHRVNVEFRGPPSNQIGTIFYFIFSTLVFSHRETIVSNLARIVLIIWFFVVLILQQSYTASLSSILTVEQLQPTLNDLTELARTNDKVGYLVDSFMPNLLKGMNFDETRLIPYNSADEYNEALSNGTVAAVVDEIPYLKVFLHKYCGKYTMVGPTYKTDGFGFAFPIGSPMVADVSRAILNITENKEIMEPLDNQYLYDDEACSVEEDGSSSSMITFRSFWGLFLITGVTSMLALLIHISMFFYQNWHIVRDTDPELSFGQRLLLLFKYHDKPDLNCADTFKEKDEEEEEKMVALEMQSTVSASYNGHGDHVVGNEDDDDGDAGTPSEGEGTPGREIGGQFPDPPSFADMLSHRRGYDSA
ncbi:glutamate receptor 2.7-like [Dioscorea cayenensis subsp. rotundata]|uniref:Glutamate receptor n=1 Tax=Dioscorea cayennensis subsp. rotundata TaxID=55577 RepID=A0AB40AYP0_DIOCR|nr:glutamate receptor 2.7-like [Dioscorea cayenensis subsp. rotundata]